MERHRGYSQGQRSFPRLHVVSTHCLFFLCGLLCGRNLRSPGTPKRQEVPITSAPKTSFTELLIASKSDKYSGHHYEHYYSEWLEPYRGVEDLKMVEIGVEYGKSLNVWLDYFGSKNANLILGLAYYDHPTTEYIDKKTKKRIVKGPEKIEINDMRVTEQSGGVIQILRGDQSDPEVMRKICEKGPYHIILDDGSHFPQHVMSTLFSLWSCLKKGGIYIVEDLETSYWDSGNQVYGYTLNGTGFGALPEHSAAEKLKQFVDVLVREKTDYNPNVVTSGGEKAPDLSIMPGDDDLCSVHFGKNVVALYKCTNLQTLRPPEYAYFGQTFDRNQIMKWIKWARSSNPKGFQY